MGIDQSISNNTSISQKIQLYINYFPSIFNQNIYNKNFLTYLKQIEKNSKNFICTKYFKKKPVITCKDCCQNYTIICLECYENNKNFHKNHNIILHSNKNGMCQCGNLDLFKNGGICNKHIGYLKTENDILNYIKLNLDENIIENINKYLDEIFKMVLPFFLECIKNNKITPNLELIRILNLLYKFFYEIGKNNCYILHLISLYLIKKCNYPTEHDCIIIDDNKVYKKSYNNIIHNCECSIIKILITVTTYQSNIENLYILFLENYLIREHIGIHIITSFMTLFKNNSYLLKDFITQFLSPNYMNKIIKTNYFIIEIFDKLMYILRFLLATKDNKSIRILEILQLSVGIYFKPSSIIYIQNNYELMKKIISLFEIFHNFNYFIVTNKFFREGFNYLENFIDYEIFSNINTMNLILNYENEEMINNLIFYISERIMKKIYKDLKENEFTFHISLIRFFSSLINRYCFYLCNKYNLDLKEAFNKIIKSIDNHDELI